MKMSSRGHGEQALISGALRRALFAGEAVAVFLVDSAALSMNRVREMVDSWLSEEETARAQRISPPLMYREHVVGRLALRMLFSDLYPAIEPDNWRAGRSTGGRPYLLAPAGEDPGQLPVFSLAHSGGYVALALHMGGEPGVDIETWDRTVDELALSRRYFSTGEADALARLSDTRRRKAFLQCWTLKEASVKADGAGLAGQLRRRCFLPGASGPRFVPFEDHYWQYWSWSAGRYCLGVALRHPQGEPTGAVQCRIGWLDPGFREDYSPSVEWQPDPDGVPSTIL